MERSRRLARTPQQRLDAGDQLTWAERLGEVVICSNSQAEDFVDLFSPRGEHDHIGIRKLPELAADLYTVHDRQHDVKHDEIWLTSARQIKRSAPIGCCQYLVLLFFKIALHQFHQRR